MSARTTGTVRFKLDPNRPPKLSKSARTRLAALTDQDVDLTDIAATYGVDWKRPGSLVPAENKQQITLRLDADLVAFFKSTGPRYQTRINAVLRSYMDAQHHHR